MINNDMKGKIDKSKYIHLELLKYGREMGIDGVSWEDVPEFMVAHGYLNAAEHEALREASMNARQCKSESAKEKILFVETLWDSSFELNPHHDTKRVLSVDSFFKLLEHEELELARKNAKSARRYSLWAIAIAFTSLLVSSVQALYQMNKPIVLSETQYQGIVDAQQATSIATQITTINKQLDKLINVSSRNMWGSHTREEK